MLGMSLGRRGVGVLFCLLYAITTVMVAFSGYRLLQNLPRTSPTLVTALLVDYMPVTLLFIACLVLGSSSLVALIDLRTASRFALVAALVAWLPYGTTF